MSDNYLPMLLAELQDRIGKLEARVQTLEADVYQPADDDDVPRTYMDGTPVR